MTPFHAIPPAARDGLLAVLAALSLGLGAYTLSLEAPLAGPDVPWGSVSYQFAWNHDRVREIMNAWGLEGRNLARHALHADFAFLLAYPLCLSLVCTRLATHPASRWPAFGTALSWIVLLCMPADALENVGLLRMLGDATRDRASDFVAVAVGVCATIKFAAVSSGIGYAVAETAGRRLQGAPRPRQ